MVRKQRIQLQKPFFCKNFFRSYVHRIRSLRNLVRSLRIRSPYGLRTFFLLRIRTLYGVSVYGAKKCHTESKKCHTESVRTTYTETPYERTEPPYERTYSVYVVRTASYVVRTDTPYGLRTTRRIRSVRTESKSPYVVCTYYVHSVRSRRTYSVYGADQRHRTGFW